MKNYNNDTPEEFFLGLAFSLTVIFAVGYGFIKLFILAFYS